MNKQNDAVKVELERLVKGFFEAVSFKAGGAPSYGRIRTLFY
jgi:hypothetical protein